IERARAPRHCRGGGPPAQCSRRGRPGAGDGAGAAAGRWPEGGDAAAVSATWRARRAGATQGLCRRPRGGMMDYSADSKSLRSFRSHLTAGLAAVVMLLGGVGGWASMTELSGAVIASGQLVVESDLKKVQH